MGHDEVALELYDMGTHKQQTAVMNAKAARQLADALRAAAAAAERL